VNELQVQMLNQMLAPFRRRCAGDARVRRVYGNGKLELADTMIKCFYTTELMLTKYDHASSQYPQQPLMMKEVMDAGCARCGGDRAAPA
jgi:hypothetical protein